MVDDIPSGGDNSERRRSKSPEKQMQGLMSRCVQEGTPLDRMKLRETGSERLELIDECRRKFARLAGIPLSKVSEGKAGEADGSSSMIITSAPAESMDLRLTQLISTIDALPPQERTVYGRVRTGQQIFEAIPDVTAFLRELDLMREPQFLGFNYRGRMVMIEGVPEAYGLGDNQFQARMRQTRVVYQSCDAYFPSAIIVVNGKNYFEVLEERDGRPIKICLSRKAQEIPRQAILMERGLPRLDDHFVSGDRWEWVGEYFKMNGDGRFERETSTWIDCLRLSDPECRSAHLWRPPEFGQNLYGHWSFNTQSPDVRRSTWAEYTDPTLGSRGVLRVKLEFTS